MAIEERLPAPAPPDRRPYLALCALALVLAAALALPSARAFLLDTLVEPLRAQADPAPGLRHGYSFASLALWGAVGAVLAWVLYDAVFVRARFEPDRGFFLALSPFVLLGPLLHAALVTGAIPPGSVLAYLASEPLVYLTIALFAAGALATGRLVRRPVLAPLALGSLALAALLVTLLPRASAEGLRLGAILLVFAAVPALVLGYASWRLRPHDPLAAVVAVVGAHALDGATTWNVLRDPLGLGFEGYGERNPVSLSLVSLSNGWPYFAVKLALPLVLLAMLRTEAREARLRAFLLFAVFVLGFGPGMANLLQVVFA